MSSSPYRRVSAMVLALLATDIQYIGFNELRQVSLYLIFYLLIHPATLFVYNNLYHLRGYCVQRVIQFIQIQLASAIYSSVSRVKTLDSQHNGLYFNFVFIVIRLLIIVNTQFNEKTIWRTSINSRIYLSRQNLNVIFF